MNDCIKCKHIFHSFTQKMLKAFIYLFLYLHYFFINVKYGVKIN